MPVLCLREESVYILTNTHCGDDDSCRELGRRFVKQDTAEYTGLPGTVGVAAFLDLYHNVSTSHRPPYQGNGKVARQCTLDIQWFLS